MASSRLNSSMDSSRRLTIHSLLNTEEDEQVVHSPQQKASTSNIPDQKRAFASHNPETDHAISNIGPRRAVNERRRKQARNDSYPTGTRERREFRPTYQQEEEYFIWYHRLDLGMEWNEVRNAYNAYFPESRRRSGFQGIQCKYYRCCSFHGIPPVRERSRIASPSRSYGIRSRLPQLWYPWMREERPREEHSSPVALRASQQA